VNAFFYDTNRFFFILDHWLNYLLKSNITEWVRLGVEGRVLMSVVVSLVGFQTYIQNLRFPIYILRSHDLTKPHHRNVNNAS